ncbi:MAG TPA: hypothetical protein VN035_13075, partial [Microbacterium sp.]|nr:hypothetical protein [Microbacterium sp.]
MPRAALPGHTVGIPDAGADSFEFRLEFGFPVLESGQTFRGSVVVALGILQPALRLSEVLLGHPHGLLRLLARAPLF